MISQTSHCLLLSITVLSLSLNGCGSIATQGGPDPVLEQLSTGMDQCLANQAAVTAQLSEQQRQLELQQQQLSTLAQDLGTTPMAPATAGNAVDCTPAAAATGKLVVGELEQVWMPNLGLALPARVDTGAETASLDARNIELFERDGKRWVRFEIVHPESGEPLALERRLKRMVGLIQANSPESERRPVIKLGITIGHINQSAEFTLSNRSHLDYQMLIGRNILQDVMVVDVSKKNIAPYKLSSAPAGAAGAAQ